jgi:non-canonical purine NTP pyrophosphatase (RdgB/HAM1 family)
MELPTFVTGNPKKAEQLSRILGVTLNHQALDLTEIQSLSLEEVVRAKAQEAYNILKTPVLIEDTSLTFHALGKLPGTLIKWFLQELGNEGLCELLLNKERSATAEVLYGLHDGTAIHLFSGSMSGSIAENPQGETQFGWDPIFIHTGTTMSRAEMSDEEADAVSMRTVALGKLRTFLENN